MEFKLVCTQHKVMLRGSPGLEPKCDEDCTQIEGQWIISTYDVVCPDGDVDCWRQWKVELV